MGCCSARTTVGTRKKLPEVSWHCGLGLPYFHGLEVEGIPLDRYLDYFSGLEPQERHQVITRVIEEGDPSTSSSRPGICHRKQVRVGLLSWNVGGISDHRKGQGAGVEEAVKDATAEVLSAAVADLGAADVIVVGLQEIISLTPSNAISATSSTNEAHKNKSFYGWPETVAEWVKLLAGGLNRRGFQEQEAPKNADAWHLRLCSEDHRAYVLYGQPVYLFGLLLCVFCAAPMLKHIRDFGMAEKALDKTLQSGAKGAVACRFVLWDRSFCFLNCHLAATTSNSQRCNLRTFRQRLRQLEKCWNEIKFKSHVNQMVYPVSAHRAIFLLGDTNMRLVNKDHCRQAKDFHNYTTQAIGATEGGYEQLWSLDQLCQELTKHYAQPSMGDEVSVGCMNAMGAENVSEEKILRLWQEPLVNEMQGPPFPPTFKLAVPGPGYSRKRVPAWTDRVLFRSDHAEPTKYGSVRQAKVLTPPRNLSDHDPVYAGFTVECTTIHPRHLGTLAREVLEISRSLPQRFPSTQLSQRAQQQAHAFHASALDTAHPEFEEMSRRINDRASVHQRSEASQLLQECQEECWRILSERLVWTLTQSVREECGPEDDGGSTDEEPQVDIAKLRVGVQEVLVQMRQELSKRSSERDTISL
eukprot:TRINITY_DN11925_c0_g1_i2.p1 TRINITY_DN11925_c0_g1~~TRINITY_DN11925_c0_g1_i2.p1  ORF type:complete len:639 (+),score=126.18 TRINITY_DN11925_c0_g1_i2:87-2003(+)